MNIEAFGELMTRECLEIDVAKKFLIYLRNGVDWPSGPS